MNAYHNLAGWLRDVRSVLGDRTELADSYYWVLRDLLEEVLELTKEPSNGDGDEDDIGDESDAEELELEDADTDVVVSRPGNGQHPGAVRRGPRPRSTRKVGGSAGVADELPREVLPQRSKRGSRAAPVAKPGKRVKRGAK